MLKRLLLLTVLFANLGIGVAFGQDISHNTFESYPDDILASLELRDSFLRSVPRTEPTQFGLEQVISTSKLWKPGSTVTVAIQGGDATLVRMIMDAAAAWTREGNLVLDFGFNPATGTFRQWSNTDTVFVADIRVGFNERGYWSLVGNDSTDPTVASAGRASLNLQQFNIRLPPNALAVAIHELGHALGFEHEHQHPQFGCDADFRWNDDAGYVPTRDIYRQFIQDPNGRRPGIYTVLGGPPNNWPRNKVDFNLRQLPDSRMFTLLPFDRFSIMKYFFEAWMFVGGSTSHCFTSAENILLSANDKLAMRSVYPLAAPSVQLMLQKRRSDLEILLAAPLSPAARQRFVHVLSALE
jgi:hypothetical protein